MTTTKEAQTINKLIVALDVSTADEARRIYEELRGVGCGFKIGMQLFTAAGSAFVRELVKKDARVFLDLKFHDIPNTVASAGVEAARLGVWMFNVHASGGREMMERTAAVVRETAMREGLRQPQVIAVTVLTSSHAGSLRDVGVEREPAEQVVKLAQLASECGLDGVVASPLEARLIREEIDNSKFLIVTPGIRFASEVTGDDQQRVSNPREAAAAGANYLVVGRPILQAADRRAATLEILTQIETPSHV